MYCKQCSKEGVGSLTEWKPRLTNYKSHIKKRNSTCKTVKYFIDECTGPITLFNPLDFIMIDVLNNVQYLSRDDVEDLLLKKEKFCIWKLVARHKGLKKTQDRNRGKRIHLDM